MRLLNVVLFFVLFLAAPGEALAYLDPGTGSVLLQLLLGGVAGVLMAAKLYWRQLLRLFRREKPEKTPPVSFDR